MPRHPLEPSVHPTVNSRSHVALPKHSQTNPDRVVLWRTQSLDEETSRAMSGSRDVEAGDENQIRGSSEVVALHSSFDAALLESEKPENSIFSIDKHDGMASSPRTKSWDEHDMDRVADAALGELSGRKHLRQNAPSAEMFQPGTVRKLPRRSDASANPGKHVALPGSAMKKTIGSLTPTSGLKRRQRTPFHHRKSPVHKGPPSLSLNRMPPTPASSSKLKPAQALTPTRSTHLSWPTTVVKASAKSNGTGVTAESSVDTDSHGTSSPAATPFRFTSFPASLPRVNNPRTESRGYNSPMPVSIKKRMTFVEDNKDGTSETAGNERSSSDVGGSDDHVGPSKSSSSQPLHLLPSQCRDDDGTHNSSFSSWSGEGGQHMTYAAPSVPPTVLEWKSPASENDMDTDEAGKNYIAGSGEGPLTGRTFPSQTPIHAQLFREDDEYGYSDDEEPAHLGGTVGRTRLNFNLVLSPDQGVTEGSKDTFQHEEQESQNVNAARESATKIDLSRTYEQRRINSFPSSVSSNTPLHNVSGYDASTASTTAFTPSRSGAGSGPIVALLDNARPQTPEEVQIHFNVDEAQCSPIPGIMEEEGVGRSMLAPRFSASKAEKESGSQGSGGKLHVSGGSEDSGVSSTTSSKMRKLRPMPDISAFETGGVTRSASSSRNEKSDESSSAPPSSPKLLCPPTPVRTPAWAHTDLGSTPVYTRANSLIVTKVLATCPPQVLDGHSSLENSLLEDEDNASSTIEQRRASLSFSTVDEEMEDSNSSNQKSKSMTERVSVHAKDAQARKESNSSPIGSPPPFLASNDLEMEAAPTSDPGEASSLKTPVIKAVPKQVSKISGASEQVVSTISFASEFENLGELGSGTFADVYKVRSKSDKQLYAVKRNRRRFRGKRDRDMALTEVRTMQRLQSVCADTGTASDESTASERTKKSLYLLFFYRAWQEDGYFFCQTELCCRDTCREMMETLRSQWTSAQKNYPSLLRNLPEEAGDAASNNDPCGRLLPEMTVWKICHDVSAGLSHIHFHNVIHHDIKPSNVFLVAHGRLGAMCKIGDFGMACDVGTIEDGQEGDTLYMARELLSTGAKNPSADIFSLGLTLYELAAGVTWDLPSEGPRWHELRSGSHVPELPQSRDPELVRLIQAMINPEPNKRPTADNILDGDKAKEAGARCDDFLGDYVKDILEFDITQERRLQLERRLSVERGQTPRNIPSDASERCLMARTPTPEAVPILFTPNPK